MAGLLVLQDAIRPDAAPAVRKLNEMGIRTVLISGDNQRTADRIAAQLGITEVHAEVLPAQKVEIVKRLQLEGRKVAFVGDGVNDGPALAVADVGIAMGRGATDVAIETAEIGLLSDDLSKLPHLLQVTKPSRRMTAGERTDVRRQPPAQLRPRRAPLRSCRTASLPSFRSAESLQLPRKPGWGAHHGPQRSAE